MVQRKLPRKRRLLPESDEAVQMQAVRAWMGTFFPKAHGIDADERPDFVELAGSSMVVLTGIYTVDWPGKCTIACYFPTVVCGTCPHNGAEPKKIREPEPEVQLELTDVEILLQKFTLHLPLKVKPMFQSRNDALYDQYELASSCRGSHARAEQPGLQRRGL